MQWRRGHEVRRDLTQHDVNGAREGGTDLDLDRWTTEELNKSGKHAVVQEIHDRAFAALADQEADPLGDPFERERRDLREDRVRQSLLDDRVADRLLEEVGHPISDGLGQLGGHPGVGAQEACDRIGDERKELRVAIQTGRVVDELIEGRNDPWPVADHDVEQDVVAHVAEQLDHVGRQRYGRFRDDERLEGCGNETLSGNHDSRNHVSGVRVRLRGGRQWHAGAQPVGSGDSEQRPRCAADAVIAAVFGIQGGRSASPTVTAVTGDQAAPAAVTAHSSRANPCSAVAAVAAGTQ